MTSTFDHQHDPHGSGPTTEHILLVEDDHQLLHVLKRLLTDAGHRVFATPDPDIALQYGFEQDISLVVVDVHLPGRNGLDLLRAFEGVKPQLPALVITGNPSVETAIEALRLRVVDYIVKPFEPRALRQQIEKLRAERTRLDRLESENRRTGAQATPPPANASKLAEARRLVGALSELLDTPGGTKAGAAGQHSGPSGNWVTHPPVEGQGQGSAQPGEARGSGSAGAGDAGFRLDAHAYPSLSPRERQIVEGLIGHGSIEHLSRELEISPYTARNHLRSIYRKLGVRSQVELVLMVTRGSRPLDAAPEPSPDNN